MFIINNFPVELNILNKYKLILKGRITLVNGLSGSGKSMLCDLISDIRANIKYNNADYKDYYKQLISFDAKQDELKVSNFKDLTGYYIFIDRADGLDDNILQYIKSDRNNCYILFTRVELNIGVSPNYICEFEDINDIIVTKYTFNEVGWY